jgi:hypothetical protein
LGKGGTRAAMGGNGDLEPILDDWQSGPNGGALGCCVYAVDVDTGMWKWRPKSNCSIQRGMTPTAGRRRVLRRSGDRSF